MEPPRVLVVDDDASVLETTSALLDQADIANLTARNLETALAMIERHAFRVIVTDQRMDTDNDGLLLLERARKIDPALRVVLVTGYGESTIAARAFELGAAGYLQKPFDAPELVFSVRGGLAQYESTRPERLASPTSQLVVRSASMKAVMDKVAKVAPTDATVLITGPTGTGKELVARAIHDRSKRRNGPFIKVACVNYADTLVESELFGHERGAFTTAIAQKLGRFELAAGGTVFLDEIGDVPAVMQKKLLTILNDRKFERVGGTKSIPTDVRIVAATNRDLPKMIANGQFREDLFGRLNLVHLEILPLRERPDDIEPIARTFLARLARTYGKTLELSAEGANILQSYAWPQNVRELENRLESLVILSDGVADSDLRAQFGSAVAPATKALTLDAAVAEAEKRAIEKALALVDGNRTRAAVILGISRRALHYKIEEYGL